MSLRRYCSRYFRSSIKEEYPGLADNQYYWNHMNRLLFSTSPEVPISRSHVAHDFGRINDLLNHRFYAIEYIQDFRSDVLNYDLLEYDFHYGICRYAIPNFPLHIIQLVKDERAGLLNGQKVFISTGKVVNKNSRTTIYKQDKAQAALLTSYRTIHPLAAHWQQYLNELPLRKFENVLKRIPEALALIPFLPNQDIVSTQLDILSSIEAQPKPLYVPSSKGNTIRLFELNKGLQGICGELREVLTQDFVEVDLQNAHLAIVAELWDIQPIQDYLSKGQSIWSTLLPDIGLLLNKINKGRIKTFFYGIIYGMSSRRLKEDMIREFNFKTYQSFIEQPIIKTLIHHRNERIKWIKSHSIYTTPMGKKIKPYSYISKKTRKYESNLTSILSQEANELEMLLLTPILEYCKESPSVDILLYQFDGLTLHFQRSSRTKQTLIKLKQKIEVAAKSLGINTSLNW